MPVLLALLLIGCASVPLSTMWRLRDFTARTFFARDPGQLRVAIRSDDKTRRGSGFPMIEIRVDAPRLTPVCFGFALMPVDAQAAGEPALDLQAGRRWYPFRLSPMGVAAFERARRELGSANLDDADINLSVTMSQVLDPPKNADHFPVRIDIAFDRADGYFTLIDETDVLRETEAAKGDVPSKPPTQASCSPVSAA